MNLGDNFVEKAADAALTTGDKLSLYASAPLDIVRWGFIVGATDLDATPNPLTAKLDHSTHVAAGTVSRSDGSGGQNLSQATDLPTGTVVYAEPSSPISVEEGDFVTIQVTAAPSAGTGAAFIEYRQKALDPSATYSDDASVSRVSDASTAI